MKIYTLVIAYNEEKEEIEYITEEMEGSSESVLEGCGAIDTGDSFDEDDLRVISGSHIIGEA